MVRLSAGTTCPGCHEAAPLRRDGTLGEHRTGIFVPFTRRRERCRFAGVTPAEAADGITSLVKRTVAFHTTGRASDEQRARFQTDPHWQRWAELVAKHRERRRDDG